MFKGWVDKVGVGRYGWGFRWLTGRLWKAQGVVWMGDPWIADVKEYDEESDLISIGECPTRFGRLLGRKETRTRYVGSGSDWREIASGKPPSVWVKRWLCGVWYSWRSECSPGRKIGY